MVETMNGFMQATVVVSIQMICRLEIETIFRLVNLIPSFLSFLGNESNTCLKTMHDSINWLYFSSLFLLNWKFMDGYEVTDMLVIPQIKTIIHWLINQIKWKRPYTIDLCSRASMMTEIFGKHNKLSLHWNFTWFSSWFEINSKGFYFDNYKNPNVYRKFHKQTLLIVQH